MKYKSNISKILHSKLSILHSLKNITLITVIILYFTTQLSAQLQNPPFLNWKKITTPHFEIVFPNEITKEGQRAANLLEHIYEPASKTLEIKPKPISVFLFNQSTTSNGYVALAPRYSAWYTTPFPSSQLLGNDDWLQSLAIHEYRHVVQQEKSNKKIARIVSFLYGQYGQVAMSWSEPLWFAEGDAVCTETALTNSGRGRIPAFDMGIRSLLLSDKNYSYDIACLGSFKKYYPSHYNLGYLMTTHVRRTYGANTWSKVLDRTSQFAIWPYAFSRSLKKITGKNVVKMYKETMSELSDLWNTQIEDLQFDKTNQINKKRKKVWTNYYDPQYTNNGSIIARKYGLDDALSLIKIDTLLIEQKLLQFNTYGKISEANDIIVWASEKTHIRWGLQSYSDIYCYDLKTDKKSKLTKNKKYFSPTLSPDGKKIAVIEYTSTMQCKLVIIDSKNANVIKQFKNPDNDFFRTPSWSADGKRIVYCNSKYDGAGISIVNTETDETTQILKPSWDNVSRPLFYKNYILYNSSYSGIDNIYAIDINNKKQFQITSCKFGVFNANISKGNDKILFQEYNIDGYNIAEMPIETQNWKSIEKVEQKSVKYYEPMVESEQNKSVFNDMKIPDTQYEVSKYSKLKNVINIHSWGFIPGNIETLANEPLPTVQFQLFSQNKLNTARMAGGYEYNINDKLGKFFINASFSKWFPIIDLKASYGNKNIEYIDADQIKTSLWDEKIIKAGFRLPFDFSQGAYQTTMEAGAAIENIKITNKSKILFEENKETDRSTSFSLKFMNLKTGSARDIATPFGQILNFKYQELYSDFLNNAKLFSASGNLYLPGFFKHHSIRLGGAYEKNTMASTKRNDKFYYYSSEILFTRGYEYQANDKFYKISFDYSLPLLYPDLTLTRLLYLKRIKGKLFYDYGIGKRKLVETEYSSAGVQISFDVNILNLPFTFNYGIRYSHRFWDNKAYIEGILLGITF